MSVTVQAKNKDGTMYKRFLVHTSSGYARPGELLGIMGPSGCAAAACFMFVFPVLCPLSGGVIACTASVTLSPITSSFAGLERQHCCRHWRTAT